MAEFITTKKVVAALDDIIRQAEEQLVLISYSVKIHETLFQLIKAADRKDVDITLVYGTEELKPDEKDQLQQLSRVKLYYNPKLHAKCFFNEKMMVITSMNLYDYSQNNWEMGVLVNSIDDKTIYDTAVNEANLIIGSSQPIEHTKKDMKVTRAKKVVSKASGYCIMCSRKTPFDMAKPYCIDCFKEAREDINNKYAPVEEYCHYCGKEFETSIDKPLCYSCYKKVY